MKHLLLAFGLVVLGFSNVAAASSSEAGQKAYLELRDGNSRYVQGRPSHANQDSARRAKTTTSQHPRAIVLSCSDSRVPPEIIFDQGIGEIFVIRTAGHAVDSHVVASIEYAVEHLGVRFLLVLGHDSCGAVKATLGTKEGATAGSESLDRLVATLRKNMPGETMEPVKDPQMRSAVKANVSNSMLQLLKHSHIIRESVEHGDLVLANGLYHLDSGKVDFWAAGDAPSGEQRESVSAQRKVSSTSVEKHHLEYNTKAETWSAEHTVH